MRLARLHVKVHISRDVLLGLTDFRVFWGKPCCCMVTFGTAKVRCYFISFSFNKWQSCFQNPFTS